MIGPTLSSEFYGLAELVLHPPDPLDRENKIREVFVPHPVYRPVVFSLISLWYLGSWTQLPDSWYCATHLPAPGPNDPGRTHTPSELAYIEQLSYRTGDAHVPGRQADRLWELEQQASFLRRSTSRWFRGSPTERTQV